MKSSAKDLVSKDLSAIVEEWLEGILCTSLHTAKIRIISVVYHVIEQVVLDQISKEVMRETVYDHLAKFFNREVADNRVSKRLRTSS